MFAHSWSRDDDWSTGCSLVVARNWRCTAQPFVRRYRRRIHPCAVQNVLLFAPLACWAHPLIFQSVDSTIASWVGWRGAKHGIEALQLLTVDRTFSVSDIVANTPAPRRRHRRTAGCERFAPGVESAVDRCPRTTLLLRRARRGNRALRGRVATVHATLDVGSLAPKFTHSCAIRGKPARLPTRVLPPCNTRCSRGSPRIYLSSCAFVGLSWPSRLPASWQRSDSGQPDHHRI